ncbi:glutathione S-transferase theta-1 [Cryptotermes secundus]|uniref:glutathione S-transferase theta-1 n=1 Tax=Cryptotermes secundus TaxID=105785 RepID=UPI000CD7CD41|nr:glutathione S-transferase theta-1 [Cryptotermes secundus]XP_023707305.1 glutathione S-transferase theta-1 [Cryptotermes secundus]XP_023707306.1 glutathione S-transferase theta-1 [Cryptotermes secundus]XP_023707307.1 glutathione S-transferase theta-1 [Cryptotermes secundus]
MTLKFYGNLLSQPCRAIFIFLKANQIPYEFKFIDMTKGEHLSEEYEKLNPLKKVPVIEDRGFILRESVGILRYLCREKKVQDHWYPTDSKQQAKVDEYLEWQHLDTRLNCAMYFQYKFLIPLLKSEPPNEKKVTEFERRMKTTLGLIENVWLKDTPYLTGNEITIADLLGACEIEQTRIAQYDARTEYPKIATWLERVRYDVNPYYDEAHGILNKMAGKSKL